MYDFETQTRYQYSIKNPLAASLQWLDGHHLIGKSGDTIFITDYDGTNQQLFASTAESAGGYLSSDLNHLFTVGPADTTSVFHLENIDMRAGSDLPKAP